jgi:hypothetical protein
MEPGDAAVGQGLALSFRSKGEVFFQFFCISLRDGLAPHSVLSLSAVRKHDLAPNTLDASVASF